MELFVINSTCCVWRRKNAAYDTKSTIPIIKHGGGNSGGVLLLSGQDNSNALIGWWAGPCTVKFWVRTSLPSARVCKIIIGRVSQHDNDPKHVQGNK